MRKPIDMSPAEEQRATDCLPGSFSYSCCCNEIVCEGGRHHPDLPMKYVKYLNDYLTSINVDPYA